MNKERLSVLREIDNLNDQNCKGCLDRPNRGDPREYSKRDRYCSHECPIGQKIKELGKLLLKREKPKTKLPPEELAEIRLADTAKKRGRGIEPKGGTEMNLTKEQYLELRLQGKKRTGIKNTYSSNATAAFYKALEKWGLKEQDAEDRVLEEMLAERSAVNKPDDQVTEPLSKETIPAESVAPSSFYGEKALEIKRLKEALEEEMKANDLATNLLNEMRSGLNQAEYEIERLKTDNAELISEVSDKEREIAALAAKQGVAAATEPAPYPLPVVTLTYALIDFGADATAQRVKVLEEAAELIEELRPVDGIDLMRTASELYDAGQAFVGLIRKQLQDLMVDDLDGAVRNYFDKNNRRHLEKMAEKIEVGRHENQA